MSAAESVPTEAPAEGTPAPTEAPANTDAAPPPASTEPTKLWSEPDANKDAAAPKETSMPDWFMKDKYKTIEDQAKAQYDMQKLMGKNWGAPKDDYTIDGIEGIVKDDPLLSHLKPHLKELGLSQDGFASLVKGYQTAQIAMADKMAAEVAETLTKTEHQAVQSVDRWLQEAFSEEDRKTVQSWILSVNDFKILNTVRLMMPTGSSVPSSTANNGVKFESTGEVDNEKIKYRKEVSTGIRVADKNFENELQGRWRDAYKREEMNKK